MWAGTSTFRVGAFHVGVRCSTPAMHELVRCALAAHLNDEVEAPANYSVLLGSGEGGGPTKGFHFLYANATPVVRSRDPERLVRGLLAHLSGFQPDATGDLHLVGRALVRDGRALVAPGVIGSWLKLVERRLNVRGFEVVDTPWVRFDSRRGAVVVPEPALQVEWSALDGLDRVAMRGGRAERWVAFGHYPVNGWALVTPDGQLGPLPRAQAVLWAATLVLNRDRLGAQDTLEGVATAMRIVPPVGIGWTDERELVDSLERAWLSTGC